MLRMAGFFVFAAAMTAAVLPSPNDAGVAMGHVHINSRDVEAQKKFWMALGAQPAKALAVNQVLTVRNALILVRAVDPTGPSVGSTVGHIGFRVKDLDRALDAVKAAGAKVLTPAEQYAKSHKAMVLAPDEVTVELVGDSAMTEPIAMHHIHFYSGATEDMRAWYAKTFAAIPGKRETFLAADLPGVNLSFSQAAAAVAPTKGRVLDHIGFEVRNLEAFCKKLADAGVTFDRPFTKRPDVGLSLAFIVDPWGALIELTEGLSQY